MLIDDSPRRQWRRAKLEELGRRRHRQSLQYTFLYDHQEEMGVPLSPTTMTLHRQCSMMSEQTLWKKQHPPEPAQASGPSLTFDKSLDLHLADEDVHLVHFPRGHTDGDTVAFFERAKVVSMGDLYFSGMYPIYHPEHDDLPPKKWTLFHAANANFSYSAGDM